MVSLFLVSTLQNKYSQIYLFFLTYIMKKFAHTEILKEQYNE